MVVYSRQRSLLHAIPRETLADRVFEQIVEAIVQGRIAPGETINEVNLSAQGLNPAHAASGRTRR